MEVDNHPMTESALRFLTGPMAGKTIRLQKPVTTIGRDTNNDIVVLDPKVSRRHAVIRWQAGSWLIENVSQNTMLINQQPRQQGALQHNITVMLGEETSFTFLSQPLAVPPPPSLAPVAPPPFAATAMPMDSPLPSTPQAYNDYVPDSTMLASQSQIGMPSLAVSSNTHSDRKVHFLGKQALSIGRDPSNDIVINEPVISTFHAQIIREGNKFVLVHPHPSRARTLNGLLYQGQKIAGDQQFRKPLERGDIFRIGDEHGTLITLTFNDGTSNRQEQLPEIHPFPLQDAVITIGRSPDNMIVLTHPQVSSHHARLEREATGGYRLVDLNSTNHTYVNGQIVTTQPLRTNDEIRIGPFRLAYTGTEITQYDESSNIRIDALNLKKRGNNQVILLDDISLTIPPRSFVALVGGSGAGKSTLMDALNGLRPAQEGTVLYNGQDYYQNLAAFSTQLGYVPQDDIVHRELTVERALYYAARLRLPSDFTQEQINQRINEVLEDVEMTDRRKLMVNKLSGGQRKRVSIALELLANPSAFFLDEPTSGLDPGLDRKMMMLLRRLADRGRTVILVTHATNNINTCDYVCFLAAGGRVAYFGPPNEAKTYFDKTDFAEIYSSLEVTKEHPNIAQEAEERFKASPEYRRYVTQPLSQRPTGPSAATPQAAQKKKRVSRGNPWAQFMLLSTRYLELLKNDLGTLLILLLQAPVIGIMLVLMVRFEIGSGVFEANKLMQCRTQILTTQGPLAVPNQQAQQTNCDVVLKFLQNDPNGTAYAQQKGSAIKALQDFILPGSGTDAQKVLFILGFTTVLFGCINGAREIVKEAPIYMRERAVNLGILPYMFSKIAVLGILCLFQSAILVVIVELGEPLHQGVILPVIAETYVTLVLTSLGGLMFGLTISAIAPNNDRAISFVPIILIPQVIFSGAIIPLKDWGTQIIATIFPTRWAMAALGSSIGLHADTVGGDKLFGNDYTYHSTLYSTYSHADAVQRILVSWGALVAIMIVLVILIGIFLKRKDVRV